MGRNRIYIRAEKFGLLALIPLYFYCGGTDDPASLGHHTRTLADHKKSRIS